MENATHNVVVIKRDDTNSVLIRDTNTNIDFWVDVLIDEKYKDVVCDWNQYIFQKDSTWDMAKKAYQEDCEFLDICMSAAIEFLENENVIKQNDDGTWAYV